MKNNILIASASLFIIFGCSKNPPFGPQDIKDLNSPLLILFNQTGSVGTGGNPMDIVLSGNYAYIANGQKGCCIIDVSNPSAPVIKGNCQTQGLSKGIALSGSYAYTANENSGLQVVDVSNPANPFQTGNLPGYFYDVEASGTYAYLVTDSGLQVVDVSNPAAPVKTIFYTISEPYNCGHPFLKLFGSYIYVVHSDSEWGMPGYWNQKSSDILIFNISDPSAPVQVNSYSYNMLTGWDTTPDVSFTNIAFSGSRMFVLFYGLGYNENSEYYYLPTMASGLIALDISNPSAISQEGLCFAFTKNKSLSFALSGSIGCLTSETGNPGALNMADLSNIRSIGAFSASGSIRNMAVSGNYVYMISPTAGMLYITDTRINL